MAASSSSSSTPSPRKKAGRGRSKSPARAAHVTSEDGTRHAIPLTALFEPPATDDASPTTVPTVSATNVNTTQAPPTDQDATDSDPHAAVRTRSRSRPNDHHHDASEHNDDERPRRTSRLRSRTSTAGDDARASTTLPAAEQEQDTQNGTEDVENAQVEPPKLGLQAPSAVASTSDLSDDFEDSGLRPNPPFGSPDGDRIPITVAFGPASSWFIRWSDGTAVYDRLPASLHSKLNSRMPTLPGVRHLSMSDTSDWFVSFDDGSFATSGFTRGKLFDALNAGDTDITLLVFAPGGGFLLVREDATMDWDRLPTGLADLLSQRTPQDAPIESVTISQLGSWFVRFEDHKCVWDGLSPRLETLVSAILRRNPPHLVLTLSPTTMGQYFLAVGSAYDHNMTIPALDQAIRFSKDKPNCLAASISYTLPRKAPKISTKEYEFIFRATPRENGLSALDDDPESIIDPSMVSDGVTPEKPGLLLRAPPAPAAPETTGLWGGTIRSRQPSHDTQHAGSASLSRADSPEIFPSESRNSPSLQIGGILNSVSSIWDNYKHHFTGEAPRSANGTTNASITGFTSPKYYSGQLSDYSEEQVTSLMNRLKNMQMVIEGKLSVPAMPDDPQVEHLIRLQSHLAKLSQSPYPIHETEYFLLYAEGFVEALTPRGLPHPWVEGYIEGRYGISSQDVSEAVELWIQRATENSQRNSQTQPMSGSVISPTEMDYPDVAEQPTDEQQSSDA